MAKNKISIPSDLLEWLEQSDGPAELSKRFGDKALTLAERQAGGAAWVAAAKLWKLIDGLPKAKQEAFKENLNVLLSALHTELEPYKKQEEKKANKGNKNAAKYSPQTIKQAVAKFNATKVTLSKSARAEISIKTLPDPKPTARTILNWVKDHS